MKAMQSQSKEIKGHRVEGALYKSELNYYRLFDLMKLAMQIFRLVFDDNGQPIDNIIIDVNLAYGKHSCLKKNEMSGRRIKEILLVVEQIWRKIYVR